MATPLTVRGQKLHELLGRYAKSAEVTALGCPGLMEFVEDGNLDGPEVKAYLRTLLLPHMEKPVGAIVLGCTHYPFLKRTIQEIVKEENLLKAPGKTGQIEYRESLPEKLPLCSRLMSLPW